MKERKFPPRATSRLSRFLWTLIGFFSFRRVTVRHRDFLPERGPVLYVGLHRNGVMDGVPYSAVAPRATALVSAQLHRNPLGRLIFPGIPVSRTKDRARGIEVDNDASLDACVAHLAAGGELLIFPEGTSSLGPHHLPFKRGAARLAQRVLAQGTPLTVVPLAPHYECAWEWQSCVEVVVGKPFQLPAQPDADVATIHARISSALETIGVSAASEQELRFIEMLAYAATLGTGLHYTDCLKRFEAGVPPALRQAAEELDEAATRAGLRRHQGVPLVPVGSAAPYFALWLVLAPPMILLMLLNLPAFAAGAFAAKRMPDDLNVVAFWRATFGIPVGLLWAFTLTTLLSLTAGAVWAAAYLASSLLMVRLYYRFRKLGVAVYNAVRAADFRLRMLRLRKTLLDAAA